MRAEVKLLIDAGTLKALLRGVSELEGALPYGDSNFNVEVVKIDMTVAPGKFELWCKNVDEERKIQSIKSVRAISGLGQKEAKDAVESLIATGNPILLGSYSAKVDAIKAMEQAKEWGSLYDMEIKGVHA
jgi:hypothetical protein